MSGKDNSSGKKFAKGGTTCLQCGDLGYDIALIFCNKCKEYAVHQYCLGKLPKTFAEDVVWCCDDCDPPEVDKKVCDEQPCSAMSEQKDSFDTKIVRPVDPKSKSKRKKSFARLRKGRGMKMKKKKQQQREKEKAVAAAAATEREEVGKTGKDLTITAKDEELKENGGSRSNIIDETLCTMEPDKGRNNRCELDLVAAMERKAVGKTGKDLTITAKDEELKENVGSTSNIIDETLCTMELDKGQNNRCELDLVLEKETNSKDVQQTKTSLVHPPVYLEVSRSLIEQAQPIIDPIWRGSLSVNNHAFCRVGRIVAHASNLASEKVFEEAKLFPQLLCSDLYPRLSMWPKGFEKWGPTDDSIALFFFPEDETNDKVFESLLSEMIRGDFALKAVVTNAELLVFTSTKLPLHLWKFRGKFFLWGVFRAKQLPSDSSNAAIARSEDSAMKDVNWRTSITNPLSIR